MEIERCFTSLETSESNKDHILYRAKREFDMGLDKFTHSTLKFLYGNLNEIYDRDSDSLSYIFFRIPKGVYNKCDKMTLKIQCNSNSTMQINSYRNTGRYNLEEGSNTIGIPIKNLEPAHNTISHTGEIELDNVCLSLNMESDKVTKQINYPQDEEFIKAATSFVLDSIIQVPEDSKYTGSCYTLYDYENECYRKPYWFWSDAPTVSVLLDYADQSDKYKEYAEQVCNIICGLYSGSQEGALISRYERFSHPNYPYESLLGPNDASFIARWALLPAYQHTNNLMYKKKAYEALSWVIRCIDNHEFLPSHYYIEREAWENKAFVDTGFTPIGFLEYDRLETLPQSWREAVKLFMDRFINQFQIDGMFYGQNYSPQDGLDKKIFSRGQGWVLAGLLATYHLTSDKKYLQKALDLGTRIIEQQNKSGSWSYLIGHKRPKERVKIMSGECEKATTVLIYYLIELCNVSGEMKFMDAAKKGIRWCEENMVLTKDSGFGGIASRNLYSGINGNSYLEMATGYANSYYILSKKRF